MIRLPNKPLQLTRRPSARPERQWFEPTDGLRTIEHLIGLLEKRNSEAQFESCTVADLLYELQVVHTILRRAKKLGEPFSFDVA